MSRRRRRRRKVDRRWIILMIDSRPGRSARAVHRRKRHRSTLDARNAARYRSRREATARAKELAGEIAKQGGPRVTLVVARATTFELAARRARPFWVDDRPSQARFAFDEGPGPGPEPETDWRSAGVGDLGLHHALHRRFGRFRTVGDLVDGMTRYPALIEDDAWEAVSAAVLLFGGSDLRRPASPGRAPATVPRAPFEWRRVGVASCVTSEALADRLTSEGTAVDAGDLWLLVERGELVEFYGWTAAEVRAVERDLLSLRADAGDLPAQIELIGGGGA